ncbi:MAG: hypothetical protein ABI743_10430, partial [bacterium]
MLLLAATIAGCGHGADPLTPDSTNSIAKPAGTEQWIATEPGILEGAARFELRLDPSTLQASIVPEGVRSGQQTIDVSHLSPSAFMTPRTIVVESVSGDAETVDLQYRITHPFPAPSDPTAAPGPLNRADLGFAGQLLVLADVPSAAGHRYFGPTPLNQVLHEVTVNTDLVVDADGYLEPGALLDLPGYTATVFPYQLLINMADLDPMSSVTPTGNYDPVTGWEAKDIGLDEIYWIGYGVLHQGQSVSNQLRFRRSALAALAGKPIGLALLIKYNDPRGGTTPAEKAANRLPPAVPDEHKFAYRMPHGALDVERIVVHDVVGCGYRSDAPSSGRLLMHVADWDATAEITSYTDLDDDPHLDRVYYEEQGAPKLAVALPEEFAQADRILVPYSTNPINDDTAVGGDSAWDSGMPTDELYYHFDLTVPHGAGVSPGEHVALVAAIDRSETYSFVHADDLGEQFLRPDLSPLTNTLIPLQITYQRVPIDFEPAPRQPEGGAVMLSYPIGYPELRRINVDSQGNSWITGYYSSKTDF